MSGRTSKIGIIFCPNNGHFNDVYPERPERVNYTQDKLTDIFPDIPVYEMKDYSRDEVINFISSTHNKEHLDLIKRKFSSINSAYSTGISSFNACLNVCMCLMTMCDLVRRGIIDYAINVVRPPGHHCSNLKPAGFCLINSAVLATKELLNSFKKIPIYDFDLHHGGGTQVEIYNNSKIMYTSQHNKNVWRDNRKLGNSDQLGGKQAPLTNINIPLPEQSCDDDYLYTGIRAIEWMSRFSSDECKNDRSPLIVVSAGFDAHHLETCVGNGKRDRMNLTSDFYGKITQEMVKKFDRIFVILEGGYNEIAISESLEAMIRAIVEKPKTITVHMKNVHRKTIKLIEELKMHFEQSEEDHLTEAMSSLKLDT